MIKNLTTLAQKCGARVASLNKEKEYYECMDYKNKKLFKTIY